MEHSQEQRPPKSKRPPKPPAPNPIAAAIHDWATNFNLNPHSNPTTTLDSANLVATAPKRWVIYEPMVLLPSGSFTAEPWSSLLASTPSSTSLAQDVQDDLWRRILHNIGAKTAEATTHLAVNDGIPLNVTKQSDESSNTTTNNAKEQENILRSPIGLRILYGDFGPASTAGPAVTQADFDRAFWVSTRQNGIVQTWAPRWTMFSRGNVKEKARLLAFHHHHHHHHQQQQEQSPSKRAAASLPGNWAVDLYAGIGYFVFSYARLGMRVLAWELNPWSVEGLRRGARANGWSVRVVQGAEELRRPAHELVSLHGGDDAQITVFLQDNREAAARVQELRSSGDGGGADRGAVLPVMHVNCGLLPRSDDSWAAAREILRPATMVKGEDKDRVLAGWLHLHENVGAQDIEQRRAEIQTLFRRCEDEAGGGRTAEVEHVELVKTFAPNVWHCVFDVCITTKSTTIKHEKKNEGR